MWLEKIRLQPDISYLLQCHCMNGIAKLLRSSPKPRAPGYNVGNFEPIRNALGTIQSLYNFLEASPKRHRMFQNIEVEGTHTKLTLKSLSVTRWSCRWEAVKAVVEQMPRIIKALLTLSVNRNPKTYTGSNALLIVILNLYLVW